MKGGTSSTDDTHQTFRNPKPDLLALLRESGPAGDENGIKGKPASKKNKKEKTVRIPFTCNAPHFTLDGRFR